MTGVLNKMLWMPPGMPVVARLGLVEVMPGTRLMYWEHEELLMQRLQDMIDEEGISLRKLDRIMHDEFTSRGFLIATRDLRHAGKDLVDHLAPNLRAAGALVLRDAHVGYTPVEGPWGYKTNISDWMKTAGLLLPPKVDASSRRSVKANTIAPPD